MIFFVFWIPENVYDDAIYSQLPATINWFYERYFEWSSRLIIEFVLIFLCKHSILFFKIITLAILLAMPIVFSNILEKKFSMYCYGVCFLFGFESMGTAGWIATFTNYYYVFFCLLISAYTLRLKNPSILLIFLPVLYATNHEQGLFIFLCVIIAHLYSGQYNKQLYIASCITLVMLLFVALSPGNEFRYYSEIQTWNPQFVSQTFFYKAYLGISTTLYKYTLVPSIPMLFLLFCIAMNKYKCIKKSSYIIFTIFTLQAFHHVFLQGQNIAEAKIPYIYAESIKEISLSQLFFIILSIYIFMYIIYLCYSLLHEKEKKQAIFILMVGLLSRFLIGFSPTLFVSRTRTYIFCEFSILAVAYIFFSHIPKTYQNKVLWVFIIAQLLHYASFL